MSDTTTPAGQTGGDATTSTRPDLTDLPERIRVHALAKLLERSSREVLDALTELGEDGRSAQSSIARDTALKIAETLLGTPDEPEPPAEPVRAALPPTPVFASASPLFMAPDPTKAPAPPPPREREVREVREVVEEPEDEDTEAGADDDGEDGGSRRRRRRGRRGRGRGKGGQDEAGDEESEDESAAADSGERDEKPSGQKKSKAKETKAKETKEDQSGEAESDADGGVVEGANQRRRRRRRRRGGDDGATGEDDPPNTVVHVRESRDEKSDSGDGRDEVRSVRGSTRLEAKRQRRRDGREAGRRRAPILSEAEFLARRESVDRAMVVRERGDRTQIAVLEDGVLVEHFVTQSGTGSLVGNVYLGRVQNVLPSMEAAFVDIGRGRNAVLYAGEVDWDAAGLEGKARKIEQALSTGDSVLVQVTKDPVGHKGARLTTQISLPGRFLVYVPAGGATGISRKLPENERRRLKDVLKRVVPEDAGVIIRTASEGISEEELARDVRRLQAQWQVINDKSNGAKGVKKANAPALLYEEPDLLVKVVRDLFTEDFSALVVEGDTAWETIDAYVRHVAPELVSKVRRHTGKSDAFTEYRIDEQLLKALDRKVWLPSGGYLVIDRTEAMTVIDVNTGKFTGSGGNLEETVTRNNLEAAEEIVRQLRLRDIGGIIVIDFIDMVLESNRDLVLRRLTECLGRDRTRHQVAEVTSLGLVQMTRKRVGTGLLEAFSAPCEHCKGRGVLVSTEPVTKVGGTNGQAGRRSRGRGGDESAKEAAASQAAKAAVRGIAKATGVSLDKAAEKVADAAEAEASAPNRTDEAPAATTNGAETPAEADVPDRGEPRADVETQDRPGTGPDRAETRDQAEVDTPHQAVALDNAQEPADPAEPAADAQPAPAGVLTTRRRRSASRPAGPPVPATTSDDGAV